MHVYGRRQLSSFTKVGECRWAGVGVGWGAYVSEKMGMGQPQIWHVKENFQEVTDVKWLGLYPFCTLVLFVSSLKLRMYSTVQLHGIETEQFTE